MTSETKQRIEQIRNGKVPEGYTKTKHGIFPSHWKVDKLGNYLQELRELSNEIEKYPIYSSSRKGLLPQSQYYDKREAVTTNLGYKKVPNGYVTYRHMSDDDIFRFNKNTTDDTVLVSSEYPVFNCNTNGDIDYILPLLNDSPRFKYYCRIHKMGGTRTRLYYKNLCQYTTAFPPLKEQQKIANILSAQDKVIECYEKKIEQLKRMKKYYLQNMFPKRGETVPRIRFKGFTDPWEQQKICDYCDMFNGDRSAKYPNTQDMVSEGIPFINAGDLVDGHVNLVTANRISRAKYDDLSGAKLQIGDIVYCLRGTLGKNAYIDSINEGTIASSLVSIRPKDIDGRFLFHVLNSDIEYRQRIICNEGAAQPNLSAKSVSEFMIPVPDLEEQKMFSSFLDNLSNLITLHQRKLEEEKKKKKALQQLLLTGIVRTN